MSGTEGKPPPGSAPGAMPGSLPNVYSSFTKVRFEALMWTSMTIALGFIIMRCLICLRLKGHLQLDDICVIASAILFLALCCCYQAGVTYLFSFSMDQGPMSESGDNSQQAQWQKFQFAITLLFWCSLWSVKASFLVFLRRLLLGTVTKRMIWWYSVTAFTVTTFIASVGLLFGSCVPLSDFFKKPRCESASGVDMNQVTLWFSAISDIISDIFIMILPWQLLWGLQVTRKQKLALACIFSLSIISILFALLRVLHTAPGIGVFSPIPQAIWTIMEMMVVIIVACLPSLKFLVVKRHRERTAGYRAGYTASTGSRSKGTAVIGHRAVASRASMDRNAIQGVNGSQEMIIPMEGIYVIKDVHLTESSESVVRSANPSTDIRGPKIHSTLSY